MPCGDLLGMEFGLEMWVCLKMASIPPKRIKKVISMRKPPVIRGWNVFTLSNIEIITDMLEHQRGAATQMFLSWLRDGQNPHGITGRTWMDLEYPAVFVVVRNPTWDELDPARAGRPSSEELINSFRFFRCQNELKFFANVRKTPPNFKCQKRTLVSPGKNM